MYVRVGSIVLLLCVIFASPARADWHSMSQAMRNQAIVDRAYRDLGNWGGQCKRWVQDVVYGASGGAVRAPTTRSAPYDYMWNPGAYVVGMSTNIRNVKPGWIVQMKWKRTGIPHTFIVVGVSASAMYVVESNYNWDERVGLRLWSFNDFDTKVGYYYAVYYIM